MKNKFCLFLLLELHILFLDCKFFLSLHLDLEVLQKLSPFDFIVSNPPYISDSEMTSLEPEVIG